MGWLVNICPYFEGEFRNFNLDVKKEMFVKVKLLEEFGPKLGRPHADTLKGSKYSNMKELRFSASGGIWRVAFAFDPMQSAILLVAANKSGKSQQRFYKDLIKIADERFYNHLKNKK